MAGAAGPGRPAARVAAGAQRRGVPAGGSGGDVHGRLSPAPPAFSTTPSTTARLARAVLNEPDRSEDENTRNRSDPAGRPRSVSLMVDSSLAVVMDRYSKLERVWRGDESVDPPRHRAGAKGCHTEKN